MSSLEAVHHTLDRLRSMGANVTVGPARTPRQIAEAEAVLGAPLPAAYKEFLAKVGSIEIELVRTWFFYGVPEPADIKATYVAEFVQAGTDPSDLSPHAQYVPARFVILADEGGYSNTGSGHVYDADLRHIRFTDGARWVSRGEHVRKDYWEFLKGKLKEIEARIADPDDILVSGSEDEVEARRKLPARS